MSAPGERTRPALPRADRPRHRAALLTPDQRRARTAAPSSADWSATLVFLQALMANREFPGSHRARSSTLRPTELLHRTDPSASRPVPPAPHLWPSAAE